jgi:hypothetical protein
MKLYQIIGVLALIAMGMTSCEEIIELDLENAEPRLVIEGVVDAGSGNGIVYLTKSNGFYDPISIELVGGATVTITQADGTEIALSSLADGVYLAGGIVANEGDTLSILVIDGEGNEYKASAKTPHSVAIDSLEIIEQEGGRGGFGGNDDTKTYQIFTHWQDKAGTESFYRVRATINDTLQANTYTLADDLLEEGEAMTRPFFQPFEGGDTVTMQLLSIDKSTYVYYDNLSSIQGAGFSSSTPFNPNSNFDNNALGYFGVLRFDSQTVILEE